MPVDPTNSASSVDYEAVYTHLGDTIERLRLVGQSLEHGKESEAQGYFQAALQHLAQVASAFHRPDMVRASHTIATVSRQIKEDTQFRIQKKER